MDLSPVILRGRRVTLVPLTADHGLALAAAIGTDPVFRYFGGLPAADGAAVPAFLAVAEAMVAAQTAVPFCTLDAATGAPIGSSRIAMIDPQHRRGEIGWTFLIPRYQRCGANREAKYLMLRHAFETMGFNRIQISTHHENIQSQTAIAALGAVREGVLRNHIIMGDGSNRHTVVFSIVPDEWPAIKARLEAQLYPDGDTPA